MIKDLFSIGEIGKVCGVSRTTLRRLEEKGLVLPAYIDENSGYRYYDNHNAITAPVSALLMEKMNELDLKPAGYLRGLCLVAPYMGKEINPDKFVARYVLPVK